LVPIAEIPCGDGKELYDGIQAIDWRDYLTSEETLAVQCTGTNDRLNHTHYTALSIKNAIIDQQRQQGIPVPLWIQKTPTCKLTLISRKIAVCLV